MLILLLKTGQNGYAVNACEWSSAPTACTLATVRGSSCRACHLHTAWCKRRSNLLSTSGFQPVERVWNNFRQTAWNITTLCHKQMGLCFWLLSYLCPGTLYMNGAFVLILKHKENRLHSIGRNIKGQDDFVVFSSFFCHPLKVWEQQMCCSYCRMGEICFISPKASPFPFLTSVFLGRSQSITAHRRFEIHTRTYELRHSIFRRVQFTIYCVSALSF